MLLTLNPSLYWGEGGANLPPGSFLLHFKNDWRQIAENLWLLLLVTLFGILFGHQGPKLLPW